MRESFNKREQLTNKTMKITHLFTAVFASATLLASAAISHAGHEISDPKINVQTSPFDKGMKEFQLGVEGMWSLDNGGEKRPALNDVDLIGRLGWMLYSPSGDGFLRGNCELLIDAGVGAIYDGPGDVLVELALVLRYNFVQPNARCVPYFQIGAGGEYSNASSSDSKQRLLGTEFLFNLQGALGVRFMLSDRSAFYVEANYRHVSNADTGSRNIGLNSLGGQVGYSWFF